MTKERWEEILECKKRFLQNNDENPLLNPHMSKEVAASWIRSKKMGINPLKKATEPHLTPTEHRKVLNDNRALIDIVRPIINTFKDMAVLTSGYILYLCEKNGAFLLQEGDMMRVPTDGLIWNENTVGTNVHSLSMRLKKPVQLMGPEHYLVALENIIASAAPIMDESGEAIATLILSQPLVEKPWEEGFEDWRSHTLGLITSIAAAVEAQMKLNKSNQKLQESYNDLRKVNDNLMTAHNTLEATLAFIDEGIITIDRRGIIIHINQEGLRILKIKPDEIGTRNIQDFLGKHSRVMSLVSKGKKVDVEETIFVKNDEQPYVINIRPVINPSSKDVDAAVLRLNHTEKINAMVAKRSGSIVRYRFEDIIGKDTGLKKVVDLARRFAHSPENVLLIGESGSGKELFAQAIHTESRPQGPFMAVNCAALPRELIESELFGYEGGSFTGAERSGRPGKIELAHGGTLFLDEIGDMPLELQAVLLRTIEDKQVMRVGGRRYNKVDFRLIAATNRNLYNMVKENQFREDLYFRLSVLTINIPPLRARKEDIEILSKYFIETYCQKQGWKVPTLSPAAQARINEYEWPGNVRQLQNAMIYAVNTTLNDTIMAEDLPSYINLEIVPTKVDGGEDYFNDDEALSLQNIERNAIKAAMLRAENYIPAAAEILGISKSTLYRKLKEYEIQY
ncbi:MAG: sigma 54-interacting transcriptional regulator [Peptococcaceae bacterium]|nr:sigma 54-interacting transcriptional regulator [Peptococcaceae bacterium]